MIAHSKLPPSRAARRVACPGSRRLEELCPSDHDSPAAKEGDDAHWLAASMIKDPSLETNSLVHEDALLKDGKTFITTEMIQGAILYKKHIFDCLYQTDTPRNQLHIEETVNISTIHPECFGTPDCWFFDGNDLYVFDYKFGHKVIEVFENWQLIEYAAGIISSLEYEGITCIGDVVFTIIQPRSFHQHGTIRKWTIARSELEKHFSILREAEQRASEEYAVCYVSPECNYCTARHICQTLQQVALNVTDQTYLNIPHVLDNVSLGKQLRTLKRAAALLEARIIGLTEEAAAMIRTGISIPHFALDSGHDHMQWKADLKEVIALGELMEISLIKPESVITPRQALKAGIPFEILKEYVEYVPGTVRLTEIDESVPRKIFGGDIDKFRNNIDNNTVK